MNLEKKLLLETNKVISSGVMPAGSLRALHPEAGTSGIATQVSASCSDYVRFRIKHTNNVKEGAMAQGRTVDKQFS